VPALSGFHVRGRQPRAPPGAKRQKGRLQSYGLFLGLDGLISRRTDETTAPRGPRRGIVTSVDSRHDSLTTVFGLLRSGIAIEWTPAPVATDCIAFAFLLGSQASYDFSCQHSQECEQMVTNFVVGQGLTLRKVDWSIAHPSSPSLVSTYRAQAGSALASGQLRPDCFRCEIAGVRRGTARRDRRSNKEPPAEISTRGMLRLIRCGWANSARHSRGARAWALPLSRCGVPLSAELAPGTSMAKAGLISPAQSLAKDQTYSADADNAETAHCPPAAPSPEDKDR
jgi:hypothetical protein